jgi:hypothetical protein
MGVGGQFNKCSGNNGLVGGYMSNVTGEGGVALGIGCVARAQFSTALGQYVRTRRIGELACGSYIDDWESNHLFTASNGTSDANRKNAFAVIDNGSLDLSCRNVNKEMYPVTSKQPSNKGWSNAGDGGFIATGEIGNTVDAQLKLVGDSAPVNSISLIDGSYVFDVDTTMPKDYVKLQVQFNKQTMKEISPGEKITLTERTSIIRLSIVLTNSGATLDGLKFTPHIKGTYTATKRFTPDMLEKLYNMLK